MTMYKSKINISEIEVPYLFQNSSPSKSKVEDRKLHYKRTGEFQKLIIREDNKRLLDGYASYIAAKELGITEATATFLSQKESIYYFTNNTKTKRKDDTKRQRIIKSKGKRCYICGRPLYDRKDPHYDGTNEFTIDHKIPLFKGGTNEKDNLFPCCNICNGLKGDFSYSKNLKNLIIAELESRNIKPELRHK